MKRNDLQNHSLKIEGGSCFTTKWTSNCSSKGSLLRGGEVNGTCMTCSTRCQVAGLPSFSQADVLRYLREDNVCYFYPRFFELQNYLARKLDKDYGEAHWSIHATSWPSFDKFTVFLNKSIIAALSSRVSADWPNDNDIVTGTFFAKDFYITQVRNNLAGSTNSRSIAKGFRKRQLVKVSVYKTNKLTPQFYIAKTRKIVSGNMLTEDQKRRRSHAVKGSILSLQEGSLESMRANNTPPYNKSPLLDLEAVHNAMTFLGLQYEFTNFVRLPSPCASFWKLARLPTEIQIRILESFSRPKDADLALSFPFPHLASHYFRTITSRFSKWLFDLCSRENMRYVCTQYVREGARVEVYRLQSQYNLYPDFSVSSASFLLALEPFAPSLGIVKSRLPNAIERYFWYNILRWEDDLYQPSSEFDGPPSRFDGPASAPNPRSDYLTQNIFPMSSMIEDHRFPSHAEQRASTLTSIDMRCLLMTLERQYLRKTGRHNSEIGMPFMDQEKVEAVYTAVLFLEEELDRIKEDIECFVRPRLLELHEVYAPSLTHFPRGLDRLTTTELSDWKSAASQLLDIFVPQLREDIFLESCADIRFLFDVARLEEEAF